jgi:hypothetical protein
MILTLVLLAAAAAPPEPRPAELKTFSDWTVGCDNGRACHAVALVPEGPAEDAITMSVRRGPEPLAAPVIAFELESNRGASAIAADGVRLKARLTRDSNGAVAVHAADAPALIPVLRTASRLQVLGRGGKPIGSVSLKGVSAALLYMDEAQKRLGTVTALARPGTKPAATVPPPPALPAVRAVRPGAGAPRLTKVRIAALRKQSKCTIDEVGGPDFQEESPIDATRSLLLLACGSGAYNVSYVPYIVSRGAKGPDVRLASFDAQDSWWKEEGRPVLINAEWDRKRSLLTSFSKGRGLGDCGVGSDYAWDGQRFRLVEQIEMGECRGSVDYITTWRTRVVR